MMKNPLKDNRYSVQKEYCGHWHKEPVKGLEQGQLFVSRFCGKWIGAEKTNVKAWALCVFHDDERTINIL